MRRRSLLAAAACALPACDGVSLVHGPAADAHAPDAAARDVAFSDAARDVAMDGDVMGAGCADDRDCPSGVCELATGRCVACTPTQDRCPADQHCDGASNACVPGCRIDEGCRAATSDGGVAGPPLRCHVVRHACVECVTDDHCPIGNLCVGSVCVPGCSDQRPCAAGQTCCAASCVDTSRNDAHCGACGRACERGRACVGGVCTASPSAGARRRGGFLA